MAKLGARLEVAAEPVVPDTIDKGEKPFLRPFMIDLSSDHYALDISRARHLLGWEPQHFILDTLPGMIARLKEDPVAWHRANGVTVNRELEIETGRRDRHGVASSVLSKGSGRLRQRLSRWQHDCRACRCAEAGPRYLGSRG